MRLGKSYVGLSSVRLPRQRKYIKVGRAHSRLPQRLEAVVDVHVKALPNLVPSADIGVVVFRVEELLDAFLDKGLCQFGMKCL